MSNYTITTSFGPKDSLSVGDANKKILGTELDVEFQAIAAAITTKQNSSTAVVPFSSSGIYAYTTARNTGLSAGVYTPIASNWAEGYDYGGVFDTSNGRLTPGYDGASYQTWLLIGRVFLYGPSATTLPDQEVVGGAITIRTGAGASSSQFYTYHRNYLSNNPWVDIPPVLFRTQAGSGYYWTLDAYSNPTNNYEVLGYLWGWRIE